MRDAPEIKGWCPGALAPMQSGDGLLMRAKIVGSRLTLREAREIAAIAEEYGNGLLDLSQRAQLQMRGISEASLDEAQSRLKAMGRLASDAASESVMNIMASPLRGVNFDANAIASRLARALMEEQALRALPGKFLFLVDDDGPLGLLGVEADIRLEASDEKIAIVLGGAREVAALSSPDAAVDAAIALARAFVTLREGRFERRRMRALVEEFGATAIFRAAGLECEPYRSRCSSPPIEKVLAAQTAGGVFFAGVSSAFGRWRAADIAALAETLQKEGVEELRLTPWRTILAFAPSLESAVRVATAARELHLVVDKNDARLAVAACPGAPECPQARGATRGDLSRLAPIAAKMARRGVGLHISGCAKGCAKPSATPVTLIANAGNFDLILDGCANAPPAAVNLSLAEVERALVAHAGKEAPCPAH